MHLGKYSYPYLVQRMLPGYNGPGPNHVNIGYYNLLQKATLCADQYTDSRVLDVSDSGKVVFTKGDQSPKAPSTVKTWHDKVWEVK